MAVGSDGGKGKNSDLAGEGVIHENAQANCNRYQHIKLVGCFTPSTATVVLLHASVWN